MSLRACLVGLVAGCGAPALEAEELPAPTRRFLVGNEGRHELFAPALAGRGGALLCVGGDHCYTLAALAGAERLYVVDHDRRVVDLHAELAGRIAAADSPAALLAGLSRAPAGDLARRWAIVADHLRGVAGRRRSWLADAELYARVRGLWAEGRVEAVVGDVAGARAMPSIARAARARGLVFTAVYLSNVEETLADRAGLRRNLEALPRSPDAALLRTFFDAAVPAADGLWSYQVEALAGYLARSGAPRPGAMRVDPREPGLSTIAEAR